MPPPPDDHYRQAYAESLADPEAFWLKQAALIDWDRPPDRAWDGAAWFAGGRLNSCFNAVDRHVLAGRGDQPALIHDSPLTGTTSRFTFAELRDQVAQLAGMIAANGVGAGDRVIIFMPMIPEAVFAMLACARIGAVHCVVFGGFAGAELARRIDNAGPRLILTASCGIEPARTIPYLPLVREALELAGQPDLPVAVLQRPQLPVELVGAGEFDWAEALANSEPHDCVTVDAAAPLYILHTSGTTGQPKGIVRTNGGHAVALTWSMGAVYGAKPGEAYWAASDIGWVVGHSYIVYGPLFHGCTTILYEGKPVGTPDAGAFWRVIRDHQVRTLFTAPTAFRAIRREDPSAKHLHQAPLPLRALFLAGERADPPTVEWAIEHLGVPVIDHWWQTELGWPALATCLGLGRSDSLPGSAGRPVPGYRIDVVGEDGASKAADAVGDLIIALPLPPGCATDLWNNPGGYRDSYLGEHPGSYCTGDAALVDEDGRVHVVARTDDIINVAGHRLSTASIESVVAADPAVAEGAVIGVPDYLRGQVPVALVVLRDETSADIIASRLNGEVRHAIGAIAGLKHVVPVAALPKTRSGKIVRKALREAIAGRPFSSGTIEDPRILENCLEALRRALAPRGGDGA